MEAGIDEAGRGCLSGPVVSSAVILPPGFRHYSIRDSKKLSVKKRQEAYKIIMDEALFWSIGIASPAEIDEINILQATFRSMKRAIDDLGSVPDKLLIDGDKFPGHLGIPFVCIIGGDDKIPAISAASILAKVTRDRIMTDLSLEYPGYEWEKNFGYGTKNHIKGIESIGLTPEHRKTFCSRFI
jgi:ribonuclease HII